MGLFEKMGNPQQNQLNQIKSDPVSMAKQAGYNIPDSLARDPQAMVKHLIQSGQVGGPALQRIMPMIQRLGGL